MRVVAIVNQKGGSAKTTTAVNLAAALVESKKKVLLIDLDPQCSATRWLDCQSDDKNVYDVIIGEGGIDDNTVNTGIKLLGMVPSSEWLIGSDKALANEIGAETILKKKLQKAEKRWDFVLLDCPPALGILTLNALVAAGEVLVPVETRVMALDGLVQLIKTIEAVRERLNPKLRVSGIVPCRVDKRTRLSMDVIKDLRKSFGNKVYKSIIRETVKLAECPSFCQPITKYDAKSSGSNDYMELAREFTRRK